ncbi:hypothetical protein JCM9279_002219 [Rhodotorula babjevae]
MWLSFHRSGRPWWLVVLPIGMTCMVAGFVLRFYYSLDDNSTKLSIYLPFYALLLLSPCTFLATDYILLPRLGRAMGDEVASTAFLVPIRFLLRFFLWSDVTTFFIQMSGGGLMAAGSSKMSNLGTKIMLVGLIAQTLSFIFFTLILVVFGLRVYCDHMHLVRPTESWRLSRFNPLSAAPSSDWRLLFWILVINCVCIIVRSIFRTIESAQGHDGYLATHEGYFYLFDALPLWIAMTLLAYCWPPRIFDGLVLVDGVSPFSNRHAAFAQGRRTPEDRRAMVYGQIDAEHDGKGYAPESIKLGAYDSQSWRVAR